MAFLTCELKSDCLRMNTTVSLILPQDIHRDAKTPPVLYLLHGCPHNHSVWQRYTALERYAEELNLAIIMPEANRSFYTDMKYGVDYFSYISRELPDLCERMFGISSDPDHRYISGLSMGGYGALRNGLKYSETFGSIVALSSALNVETALNLTNDAPIFMMRRDYMEACFGDLEAAQNSDVNPKWLIKQCKEQKKPIPNIYMAIGDEDSLLGVNEDFVAFLRQEHVPVTFEVRPGNHEWDFWDTYIKKAIYEWLPTEKNGMGINSGNVGI